MRRRTLPFVLLFASSCRHSETPAIDPALASCVPPGASVIAGLDLNRLRANPLFARAPVLDPFREASSALVVLSGSDLLVIARGDFRQPPAGATMLDPHLAVAGTPGAIAAASAQHSKGATGTPDLVERATSDTLWIVARGSATLPVTGNAANLNRFLNYTDYTVVTANLGDQAATVQVTATARTEDSATKFEESLRAWVSLAGLTASRQPALAAAAQSVQIRRDGPVVHTSLTVPVDSLIKLLP